MKRAIAYQLVLLAAYAWIASLSFLGVLPSWLTDHQLPLRCALIGGFAGTVYCLCGVYITVCVREKKWDDRWLPWYFIRPIVSPCCGLVSYLFLKAGLLVLSSAEGNQHYGFYAIAFIAGYNVDKFLKKIEDVGEAAWGISISPTGQRNAQHPEGDAHKDKPATGGS